MENKITILVLSLVFLSVIGIIGFLVFDNSNVQRKEFQSVLTGSTENGDVAIELTPEGMDNGRFIVKVAANTHSVDLNQFDLKEITTLEYGTKQVKPEDAPRLSGHHASGILTFDVNDDIDSFSIKINGIPGIEERVFEW